MSRFTLCINVIFYILITLSEYRLHFNSSCKYYVSIVIYMPGLFTKKKRERDPSWLSEHLNATSVE